MKAYMVPPSALPNHPDDQQQTDDERTHGGQQGPFQTVQGFGHQSLLQQRRLKKPVQSLRPEPGLAGLDLGRRAHVRAHLVQRDQRILVRRVELAVDGFGSPFP